jgi:hypothetical protein
MKDLSGWAKKILAIGSLRDHFLAKYLLLTHAGNRGYSLQELAVKSVLKGQKNTCGF